MMHNWLKSADSQLSVLTAEVLDLSQPEDQWAWHDISPLPTWHNGSFTPVIRNNIYLPGILFDNWCRFFGVNTLPNRATQETLLIGCLTCLKLRLGWGINKVLAQGLNTLSLWSYQIVLLFVPSNLGYTLHFLAYWALNPNQKWSDIRENCWFSSLWCRQW